MTTLTSGVGRQTLHKTLWGRLQVSDRRTAGRGTIQRVSGVRCPIRFDVQKNCCQFSCQRGFENRDRKVVFIYTEYVRFGVFRMALLVWWLWNPIWKIYLIWLEE